MDTLFIYAAAAVFFAVSFFRDRAKTASAAVKAARAFAGILPLLIAVLFIVSIVLAGFEPEHISRFIGEESGVAGILIAGLIGAITLVPGFVAFPAAGELLRNGAGTLQVAAFVSALMMVGATTLPLEIRYFGKRTALLRNGLALLFSFSAAYFVAWAVSL